MVNTLSQFQSPSPVSFNQSLLAKLPNELLEYIFDCLQRWEIPQAVVSFSLVARSAYEIVQCFNPRMTKTNQVTFCRQLLQAQKGLLKARLVALPPSTLCRGMRFLFQLQCVGFVRSGKAVYYSRAEKLFLTLQPLCGKGAVYPAANAQIRGFLSLGQDDFVVIDENGLFVFDADKNKLSFHELIPADKNYKILDGGRSGNLIFLLIAKIFSSIAPVLSCQMTLKVKFDLTTRSYTSEALDDSSFARAAFFTVFTDLFPINFITNSELCFLDARFLEQAMDSQLQSHSNLKSLEHTKNTGASINLGRQVYQLQPDGSRTLFAVLPNSVKGSGRNHLSFYKNKSWLVCVEKIRLATEDDLFNPFSSPKESIFLYVFNSEGKVFLSESVLSLPFKSRSSVCLKDHFFIIGNLEKCRLNLSILHIPTKKIMTVQKCKSCFKLGSTLHGLDLIEKDDGTYQLLVFLASMELGTTPLVYQVEFSND